MDVLAITPLEAKNTAALVALWEACDLTRPWNNAHQDIEKALNTGTAEIFTGWLEDELVASVMCGFDGHRGWLYYLAVAPAHRGTGFGRRILEEAETWLQAQGAHKVQLMIRGDNQFVRTFYEKQGYGFEDRVVMAKRLDDSQPAEPPKLPVTITWLEMTSPPGHPPAPAPLHEAPIALTRLHSPTVCFYRYLYDSIGEPWLWWDRRLWSDEELQAAITAENTDIYLLSVGSIPAGFSELVYRADDNTVELAYFGLAPEFIGRGFGPYLLDWTIKTAWEHPSAPKRLELNTCTLDHPSALATYQKAGFTPFRQETQEVPDPRARGIIPADVKLAQELHQPS